MNIISRLHPHTTTLVTLYLAAFSVAGCEGSTPRPSQFDIENGATFSRWQLQCAIYAVQDQRDANAAIREWEECGPSLPRLSRQHEELRQEWQAERRAEWTARCSKEAVSLQEACLAGRQESLKDFPGHLKIPPEYEEITIPGFGAPEVTDRLWQQARSESDLKATAIRIVMDNAASLAEFSSRPRHPPSASRVDSTELSQADKGVSAIGFDGGCKKWIGRESHDKKLISPEYLDEKIAECKSR